MASIDDKIRDVKIIWFRHIRRSTDAPVRRCEKIDRSNHRKSTGRSKKS